MYPERTRRKLMLVTFWGNRHSELRSECNQPDLPQRLFETMTMQRRQQRIDSGVAGVDVPPHASALQ